MNESRVPLFDRLPEIYRTRDIEQQPPNPLRAFLGVIESAFGALHADIARLYDNLFIDTCDDWVVPYIADLLGTSHLKGEPRTLRADVADTIALRRRKGTLGAIERLAFDLTGWTCRAVELRENLAWTQNLNHQRPDTAGALLLRSATLSRLDVPRGGTAPIRDPRELALLGTAFDRFAYTADTRPAVDDVRHVNLPDLAIFVWRLDAMRLPLVRPLAKGAIDLGAQAPGLARFALRFDLHPLDMPVRLFSAGGGSAGATTLTGASVMPLTSADAVPGPMLDARLTSGMPGASPDDYVHIDFFDDAAPALTGLELGDAGLHLFLPQSLSPLLVPADGSAVWTWRFRGDNLCAWETGLRAPLASGEIVVDPDIGRVLIGLDTEAQRDTLFEGTNGSGEAAWFASYTYGAAGPVGAHPVSRPLAGDDEDAELRQVTSFGPLTLQQALEGLEVATRDVIVEIGDSFVHTLDIGPLADTSVDSQPALRVAHSLTIRASSGQRPVVLLARPLGWRPVVAAAAGNEGPVVRLEGLYLAPDPVSFPGGAPLIARAAVARLDIVGCTLAPGGHARRDGSRVPMQPALALANGYGFDDGDEERAFRPTPVVLLQRSISGAIAIDDRYTLTLEASIVDAGSGVGGTTDAIAIGPVAAGLRATAAPLDFDGLTCLGGVRTLRAVGSGGLFTRRFEAFDNQHGCIKHSWFAGGDRLPPNHFCLRAADAPLNFGAERFNDPGYAQVARASDVRIRTLGPGDDTMGAFGFQLEAHKWTNLHVRLREFMPVGVRPLVVPVT